MAKTQLEIIGPYADGGWEDEHGTSFFNDRVRAGGYGMLGKLQVEWEPTIVRADELVIMRRGFPDEWTAPTDGVSIEQNPFGFYVFELQASNGIVRYRLIDDELSWKIGTFEDEQQDDENARIAKFQLGLLTYSDWTPVREAPAEIRQEITTKDLKLVDPRSIPADAKGIQL